MENEYLETLRQTCQNLVQNFPSWVLCEVKDPVEFAKRISQEASCFINYEKRMLSCHKEALAVAHMDKIRKMTEEERASRLEEVKHFIERVKNKWEMSSGLTGDKNLIFYRTMTEMATNPHTISMFEEYEFLVKWDAICKTEEEKNVLNNRLKEVQTIEDVWNLHKEVINKGYDMYTKRNKADINSFFESNEDGYLSYVDNQSDTIHKCRYENLYKCVMVA